MTIELYDPNIHPQKPPAGTQLVYNGGWIMDPLKIVALYLDAFPFVKEMDTFLSWYVLGSSLLTELSEYTFSGQATFSASVSLSLLTGSVPPPIPVPPVPVPPPPRGHRCPPGCVKSHHRATPSHVLELARYKRLSAAKGKILTDGDMQIFLTNVIASGSVPPADQDTLYILFLPDGVSILLGSDESCVTYCGYHSSYTAPNNTNVIYAVMPFPSCDGCLGGLSQLDALTSTTSHEISEAITDPINGSGWVDNATGEEVGDLCAWQTRKDGSYVVQLEWSNKQGKCI